MATAKTFGAPWGTRIWLITAGVSLLGVLVATTLVLVLPLKENERWAAWVVPGVVLAIIGGTGLWSVRGYEIRNDAVVVRRCLWVNRIPLASIESAEIDPEACRGAWKTMGNDGLFAMHGRFRSKRLGKFQAYVTRVENSIVLRVPGDVIVISPDSPRAFVNELNRRLGRLKEQR